MDRRLARRLAPLLLVLAPWAGGCGTLGYRLEAPYDPAIQTVYVPVFRSFSFRTDLNLMLTEEVIKELERRSIYRVVDSPEEADAILSGTILFANKYEVVVNPFNLPRQLTADLTAEVTLEDIRPGSDPDVEPPKVRVYETVPLYPELGETTMLAYKKAIREMARDIVNMMEDPW